MLGHSFLRSGLKEIIEIWILSDTWKLISPHIRILGNLLEQQRWINSVQGGTSLLLLNIRRWWGGEEVDTSLKGALEF